MCATPMSRDGAASGLPEPIACLCVAPDSRTVHEPCIQRMQRCTTVSLTMCQSAVKMCSVRTSHLPNLVM